MEKQSSISSSKYISSTLDNVILNSNINLTKMKEVLDTLDKAANAVIIPVLKIQKKISNKFDLLTKDNETKEKIQSPKKDLNFPPQELKNDFMQNIQNSQINQKVINNHENMLQFYEYINHNIDLFTKLNKS